MTRKTLLHIGHSAFEIPVIWHKPKRWLKRHVLNIYGIEALQKEPVLGIAPHMGCWEIIGQALSWIHPHRAHFFYQIPDCQALDNLFHKRRTRLGQKLLPTTTKGIGEGWQHILKKTGSVFILPDQDPEEQGGIISPFFGIPTPTATLLAKMIYKSKAPTVFCFARRIPYKGFDIFFVPVDYRSYDLEGVVHAINRDIETFVRECPEQYQWTYARFKNVDGVRMRYKKNKTSK